MNAEPAWLTNWQANPQPPRAVTTHYEGPIITRWEAFAQGLTLYFTGKPCLRGHIAQRHIKKGCVECEARARALAGPKQRGRPLGSTNGTSSSRNRSGQVFRHGMLEGFDADPPSWPDDGGSKRIPIYDRNFEPPRLVRKVGWVNCLGRFAVGNPHRFLSPDVQKVRMCCRCKTPEYAHNTD